MNGSPTFEGLTQQALDEHRQIHFYLDQFATTLAGLRTGPGDVEAMRRLAAQLDALRERLTEHLHAEEDAGGLFEAIQDVLPACRVEIDRLRQQHLRMMDILQMARLHALGAGSADLDPLREDLERFLETFREHERKEEELLAQAIEKERRASE